MAAAAAVAAAEEEVGALLGPRTESTLYGALAWGVVSRILRCARLAGAVLRLQLECLVHGRAAAYVAARALYRLIRAGGAGAGGVWYMAGLCLKSRNAHNVADCGNYGTLHNQV